MTMTMTLSFRAMKDDSGEDTGSSQENLLNLSGTGFSLKKFVSIFVTEHRIKIGQNNIVMLIGTISNWGRRSIRIC